MDLLTFINIITAAHASKPKHFYHFTSSANLPSIKLNGLLSMRRLHEMSLNPETGGDYQSLQSDKRSGMDHFVHLCLFPDHPMQKAATAQGRFSTAAYLKIDPCIILVPGAKISDRASNHSEAKIDLAATMLDEIDHSIVYQYSDWKTEANQTRLKAAHMYEILIPDQVPLRFIVNPNG